MKALFFFVAGILFYEIVFPLISDLYTFISQMLAYLSNIFIMKSYEITKDLNNNQAEEAQEFTQAIGFHYEPEEEYYDDWDEEDHHKTRR